MDGTMAMDHSLVHERFTNLNEDYMVKAAQQGDLDSYNKLVLFYQDRIFGFVNRIVGDENLAADITQDTFIRAYQSLSNFRNGSFRSWLYQIAKNASFDELRRNKKRILVSIDSEDEEEEGTSLLSFLASDEPSPEQVYDRRELSLAIQKALDCLSPDQRAVIVLVDIQEMEYQEAAEALGINIGTVKSRLARARLHMREYIF